MMKSKTAVLTVAERCRNILGSNWQGFFNTVKADAQGSKSEIHTSKIHYMFKRGKPYLLVHEGDLHNTNIIIDERGSLSISNIIPGPLMGLLNSLRKLPPRVALSGDVIPLKDDKVHAFMESVQESIIKEHKIVSEASYAVSSLLSSSSPSCKSRWESLQELLEQSENYAIYKFNIRSCTYVDGSGKTEDLDISKVDAPKANPLLSSCGKIVDGINQSQTRRRVLMLFCLEYYNAPARDALMLSIDHKGFDVLAKIPETTTSNAVHYLWKEFRFSFQEAAADLESFCHQLVKLEEETLQSIRSYSGLG